MSEISKAPGSGMITRHFLPETGRDAKMRAIEQ
jgi:hypothetical protein